MAFMKSQDLTKSDLGKIKALKKAQSVFQGNEVEARIFRMGIALLGIFFGFAFLAVYLGIAWHK